MNNEYNRSALYLVTLAHITHTITLNLVLHTIE